MAENDWLTERFEEHRGRLRAVAYRMLGSGAEAEDAVQEAWLRLHRADTSEVENLAGWLTTVVARVCLNVLQSRKTRREDPLDELSAEPVQRSEIDPEHQALLADAVGPALLVVLDTLAPAERLSFVLHDMFAVPFDEIAGIVGKSPAATRQLASRARRRVRGAEPTGDGDQARQRAVVDAFLNASRNGEFEALLELLDPDVVMRADPVAVLSGAGEARGAHAVAEHFSGRARAARLALLDGAAGFIWSQAGQVRAAFEFTVVGGRIVAIELLMDPELLAGLEVELIAG